MSMLTDVSMAKKQTKTKTVSDGFVSKISSYGTGGRKHIEVPKKERDNFEVGDHVRVKKISK